jgi:hypothetical protein
MQQGSLQRKTRKHGPEVWQFRWSERGQNGRRICRKRVIGTVERYRDSDTARHAVAGLVTEINSNDQIRGFSVLGVELLYWRQRRRVLLGGRWVEPSDSECCSGTDKDDIMISYGKRRRRGPVCRTKYRERR